MLKMSGNKSFRKIPFVEETEGLKKPYFHRLFIYLGDSSPCLALAVLSNNVLFDNKHPENDLYFLHIAGLVSE